MTTESVIALFLGIWFGSALSNLAWIIAKGMSCT